MKKVFVFHHNQVALDIIVESGSHQSSSNHKVQFGLNRDRQPDSSWNELRNTRLDQAVELELTPELKQVLLEDLAYAYGQDSEKFTEKLKEFKLIL